MTEGDELIFMDESYGAEENNLQPWVIAVIDDERAVFDTTLLALDGLKFDGRHFKFLYAASGQEGLALLSSHHDIACVLLDVVMETERAGLDLARAIRDQLGNYNVRIILRTGQPGYAPPMEIIEHYDISDYKEKTELTRTSLFASLACSLRSYRYISALEKNRRGLQMIVDTSSDLMNERGNADYSEALLGQIQKHFGGQTSALVLIRPAQDSPPLVTGAVGRFKPHLTQSLPEINDPQTQSLIEECFVERSTFFQNDCIALPLKGNEWTGALYLELPHNVDTIEIELLELLCSNITFGYENMQLLERLSQSLQESQTIFDTVTMGVAILNPNDRRYLKVNRSYCSIFGYRADELLGQSSRILYQSDEDFDRFAQDAYPNLSLGKIYTAEVQLRRKDGSLRWIKLSGSKGFMEVEGLSVWCADDITDRRLNEEKLKRTLAELQLVLENASLGICTIIPSQDGEQHGPQIGSCNQAFEQMLGFKEGQPIGCSPRVLFASDDHYERFNHIYLHAGAPSRFDFQLWHQEHHLIEVELCWAAINPNNLDEGVLWLIEDITTRSEAQEALRQHQVDLEQRVNDRTSELSAAIAELQTIEIALREAKISAEAASEAKSNFLANMSHEIRTPMNAIIGLSQLALRTDLNPRQNDYVTKIHRSAIALLGIINDILDFSKIEAGKMSMENVPFELSKVMTDLAVAVDLKVKEKGLELEFLPHLDVPNIMVGDGLRLSQVLLNLVGNAVKFTAQGKISVLIEPLESNDHHVFLKFSVQDTGIGMTPEQQSRLFSAFSQADNSITRQFGGTGLGLTISKRLAEMMGGSIGVTSNPGQGSTFWFTARFELTQNRVPDHKASLLADTHALNGTRILLVDDNASTRLILARILQGFGCLVSESTSGEEAISIFDGAHHPFDLIILDWRMNELNGIETAQCLFDRRATITPKQIIIISASEDDDGDIDEQVKTLCLGGYLVKPVSPSTLFNLMNQILHKESISSLGQPSQVSKQTAQRWQGIHLLLVEDNDFNQLIAVEILEQVGIKVTVANNGREGVNAVFSQTFDGVLMDVQMPVLDGYSATREIRANPHYAKLPIIAMTANAMVGDREKALESGMNDHVPKPLDFENVFNVLDQWIPCLNKS